MLKGFGKKPVKYTPPRRAKNWTPLLGKSIRKLIMLLFVSSLIGLMFSGLQAIGISWLVSFLTVLIIAGLALLYFNEGMSTGVRDTEVSRRVEKLEKDGQHIMAGDDSACYSPIRAIVSALLAFLVPILLAALVAFFSKPYTYVLQDLPSWISSSYGSRSDIMVPLGEYMAEASMEPVDWVRLVIRVLGMLFINLFADPLTQSHLIDITLPLFFFIYPCAYITGYLRGPHRQAVLARKQRRAKKIAVKKAQKRSLAEELTSTGAEVHYGQRNDRADDKKRLI